MRCDQFDELIESIVAGEVPLTGDAATHAASCPRCRRALAVARALDGLLAAQPSPPKRPELTAAVVTKVRRDRWRSEQLLDLSFNVTVAAAIVLLLGGVWLLVSLSGLGGVGSDAVTVFTQGIGVAVARLRPMLPVYALATVLLVATWGIWLWAEGLE